MDVRHFRPVSTRWPWNDTAASAAGTAINLPSLQKDKIGSAQTYTFVWLILLIIENWFCQDLYIRLVDPANH